MKIVVFGANGQLGRKLRDYSANCAKHQFIFTDIEELDITNPSAVNDFIQQQQPEVMINCAAYTAVDKAETEPELADKINHKAVEILARTATKYNSFFVHVSTDYVFDGRACQPYTEKDATGPISIYGSTKLAGEQAFSDSGCKGAIVRTAWLYSEYGNNFVKTMLRLGKEKELLTVVFDQIGTPTYAGDLAEAIMTIVDNKEQIPGQEIFHFSNEGAISWYDFATTIMELSALKCKVLPILSSQYKVLANRPNYSVFDKSKYKNYFAKEIPYWKKSLEVCLHILLNQ